MKKLSLLALSLIFALLLSACSINITLGTEKESGEKQSEPTVQSSVQSTEEKTEQKSESKVEAQEKTEEKPESKPEEKTESKTSAPKKESVPQTSSSKTQSTQTSSGQSQITKDKALSIALKDAGLKKADIRDLEIELDREKGVLFYDISFEHGKNDYDYDINAKTGKIISVDKPNATSSKVNTTKEKAKETVLNHAGLKADAISRYEVELEKDDGVWKYEISFRSGNYEYDYTVNAENGKIIKHEKEFDD